MFILKEKKVEYKVENISPVKVRVTISTPPEEVTSALAASLAVFKNRVQLDGFRKGKVPASIIEKRFHDEIYNEARQDLFNVHINQIIEKLDAHPVSGIIINGEDNPLERGKDFVYSLEFEVLPEFDLPNYKGLEVEQEKTVVDPDIPKKMVERLRLMSAKLKPVEGIDPPKNGQVAVISFSGSEEGSDTPYVSATDFELPIGENESLPEFENLIKGIPVGNTAEKEIEFPEDFVDPHIAGKKLLMRVTVNAVKERDFSEFDKRLENSQDALNSLSKSLENSYEMEMTNAHKAAAQTKLLDQLLKMTDFPIPETMLQFEKDHILAEWEASLARDGKNLSALGKTKEELEAEVLPSAEKNARRQTLLMKIAQKEKLEVSDKEVAQHIHDSVRASGHKFEEVVESMRANGLIYRLRDHMLADKGMDFIYDHANITMIDPVNKDQQAENTTHEDSGEK